MNSKSIWFWSAAALVLLSLIIAHHWLRPPVSIGPPKVLPSLTSGKVSEVHVRPKGQLELRVVRDGPHWVVAAPVKYPALSVSIDQLLLLLEKLSPATTITAAELRQNPAAREKYGFADPQASVVLVQDNARIQLLIGALTAPGDQVFIQVVGMEEVFVVDAGLLAFVPKAVNDWRDTAFVRLKELSFDHLTVTNGSRWFGLVRAGDGKPWRMVFPIDARADNARLAELLQLLESLQVLQFVSDAPKADLEPFGLQKPELQIALGLGTNQVAILQFGGSPTNAPDQVYARWEGIDSVVTVSRQLLAPWRLSVNEMRDPHLISDPAPVTAIAVAGAENFTLQQHTNEWRVLPENIVADPALVRALLTAFAKLTIMEFTKDIVTTNDLPTYGLATPVQTYVLQAAIPGTTGSTNRVIAQVEFGTNTADRIYVRRTDEASVYAVSLKDAYRLPTRAFQLRSRQLWSFPDDQLASVTIRQAARVRQLLRQGPHDWALAPGSQGIINELAIGETVRPLCSFEAYAWVARGQDERERFALGDNAHQITLELKDGTRKTIFIGTAEPGQRAYGGVQLDGDFWIFEFEPALYRFIASYLTIPG